MGTGVSGEAVDKGILQILEACAVPRRRGTRGEGRLTTRATLAAPSADPNAAGARAVIATLPGTVAGVAAAVAAAHPRIQVGRASNIAPKTPPLTPHHPPAGGTAPPAPLQRPGAALLHAHDAPRAGRLGRGRVRPRGGGGGVVAALSRGLPHRCRSLLVADVTKLPTPVPASLLDPALRLQARQTMGGGGSCTRLSWLTCESHCLPLPLPLAPCCSASSSCAPPPAPLCRSPDRSAPHE